MVGSLSWILALLEPSTTRPSLSSRRLVLQGGWPLNRSLQTLCMEIDVLINLSSGLFFTDFCRVGNRSMACMMEAMGLALPFNATTPAVDAQRRRIAHESGRLIVQMARNDVRLSKILTRNAFENAIRVLSAIGGSTNAVIHLLAFAGRLGIPLELAEFDRLSADVPLLVDLQPSGRFLMEDLHYAGGLPAVMKELAPLLDLTAPTVRGEPLGASFAAAECYNRDVIRTIA